MVCRVELEQQVFPESPVQVVCRVTPVTPEELVNPVDEVPLEQPDSPDLWAKLDSRVSRDCRARRVK